MGGRFDVTGTPTNRVTLTSSTPTNNWWGINFTNAGYGVITYADLTRLSGSGGAGAITVSGTSMPNFEFSTPDVLSGSYVFGIRVTSSGGINRRIYLYRSTVTSASAPALYASGSGAQIYLHFYIPSGFARQRS